MAQYANQKFNGTDSLLRMFPFPKSSYMPTSFRNNVFNFDIASYSEMPVGTQREYKYLAQTARITLGAPVHDLSVPGSLHKGKRTNYLGGELSLEQLIPVIHIADSAFSDIGNPNSTNLTLIGEILRRETSGGGGSVSVIRDKYDGVYLWYIALALKLPNDAPQDFLMFYGYWVITQLRISYSDGPVILGMNFRTNGFICVSNKGQ